MAIGTTPLFSKISGSVGPVDYRTRRNGKIEIGKKRIPANPQSTRQLEVRNGYGRLHELWQNADWIDKTQYENLAEKYNISTWNAFLMRHLPAMSLNPLAYWGCAEGTGTTLHDFTTNNLHGNISGCSWITRGPLEIPGLYFDGIDDVVVIPLSSILNTPNATLETIISFNDMPYAGQIVINLENRYRILAGDVSASVISCRFKTNITPWPFGTVVGVTPLKKNEFINASASYDGANVRLLLNGIQDGIKPETGVLSNQVVNPLIGDIAIPPTWPFHGEIMEVSIYGTGLSNTELLKKSETNHKILEIYN